jgi:S1-C subfamily serine protease
LADFVAATMKLPSSVKGHWSSSETFIAVFNAAKAGERSAIQAIVEEANEQDSPVLDVLAAEVYESESSPVKDAFAAERWYWKAAQADHGDVGMVALAQEELALKARAHDNDPRQERKALALLLVAAVNGSDTATYSVGQIMLTSQHEYFPTQKLMGVAFVRYAATGPGAKALAEPYLEDLRQYFGDENWARFIHATDPMLAWWNQEGILGLGRVDESAVPVPIKEGREDMLLKSVAAAITAAMTPKKEPKASNAAPKAKRAWSGSGLYITYDGKVLTNYHVIGQCTSIRLFPSGEKAVVLAKDKGRDLALLSTATAPLAIAEFSSTIPELGDKVLVAGYPLIGVLSPELSVSEGVVSALSAFTPKDGWLRITAPVQSGNSGGPALDSRGNVIGVVVAKLDAQGLKQRTGMDAENVNFAISAPLVQDFLGQSGVKSATSSRPASVGSVAQRITVGLVCE